MNKLEISEGVKSKEDFYDEISRLLQLQSWFGRNLSALNDVLRGGCGEVEPSGKVFVWKGSAAAKEALGSVFWEDIMEVFMDDDDSGHEAFVVELE